MSSKQSTMKIDREFTVKRTKHPSAPRYNGRANQELGSALTKLMSLLDSTEVNQLCERSLIIDEEGTALDFDSMLKTDVIGIALDFEGEGYISTILEVLSNENEMITGKDSFTEEEVTFTFEEASVARAMGYFEILYRKDASGKDIPFGVDNDLKVKVMVEVPEEPAVVSGGVIAEPVVPLEPAQSAGTEGALAKPGFELPENIESITSASTNPDVLKSLLDVVKTTEGEAASGIVPHVEASCGGDCSSCTTCTPKAKTNKKCSSAAEGRKIGFSVSTCICRCTYCSVGDHDSCETCFCQ